MFKFVVLCALVAAAVAVTEDGHAQIKHFSSDVHPEGFEYTFETSNGISAAQKGDEHGNTKGGFSWISPEGIHVAFSFIADENGYQPKSGFVPVPPPIPAAILKSLEYIRTHPPSSPSTEYTGYPKRI